MKKEVIIGILILIIFIVLVITGFFIFIFPIVGILCFIGGFSWLKLKHTVENTPTSKIRSIAMGPVEINGNVIAAKDKILKSPLTNKDCVYYKVTVESYKSDKRGSHWSLVHSDEQMAHFYLKDDTGFVLIDPKGAQIEIPEDFEFNSGLGKDPTQNVASYLSKNNLKFENMLGINKTMRYKEYFIAPKDKLFIFGYAKDNPFMKEGMALAGMHDVMIGSGHKLGTFYYISDKQEKDIIKKFKWMSLLMFFLSLIFIIVGTVFIFERYNMLK